MEKYAVSEEEHEQDEKRADAGRCPKCGSECETHGRTKICPKCGSEPFEKENKNG